MKEILQSLLQFVSVLRSLLRRHMHIPPPLTLQELQHTEHILQEKMTVAKRAYESNLVHAIASSKNSRIN